MLKLSLIGMSGAGKSHWTQKLSAAGFRAISIDDRIEKNSRRNLRPAGIGHRWSRGLDGVAGPAYLS